MLRWIEPFAYQAGQPFRVMPLGTFKRGERTLTITKDDLAQMAANFESGRPRWKVPLYFGHPTVEQPDPPKIGNVQKLEVRDDGLYAVPEYTGKGKASVEAGEYQFVSPGVLWNKNGSAYVDEQGRQFDNVIEHVALTNRPFFGQHVALFSEPGVLEHMAEHEDEGESHEGRMARMKRMLRQMLSMMGGEEMAGAEPGAETFRDYDAETRRAFAEKGWALPDGSYPVADKSDLQNAIHAIGRGKTPHGAIRNHIIKRAKALGATNMLPPDWADSTKEESSDSEQGVENMADKIDAQPIISAEEFAALKAKADKLDGLEVEIGTLKSKAAEADTFAAQLVEMKRQRRRDQLLRRAEQFVAIPEKPEILAEKLQALEEKDADLFKWLDGLLGTLDQQLVTADLFGQKSVAQKEQADTFEAAVEARLAEKFGGDRAKYAEAMEAVGAERPDLAYQYTLRQRKAR